MHYRWRCPRCRRAKSIRVNSWFSRSHLSIEQILELTYLWTEDLSQKTIMKWVDISSKSTIVDWCNFCRELCAVFMAEHSQKIGGPGTVVEVDEAKFGKRRNRQRLHGSRSDKRCCDFTPHNFKACTTWNRDSYRRMAFLRSIAASGIPAPYRESFR